MALAGPLAAAGDLDVFQQLDPWAKPLWPGFDPSKVAVEVYDGTRTFLVDVSFSPSGA